MYLKFLLFQDEFMIVAYFIKFSGLNVERKERKI